MPPEDLINWLLQGDAAIRFQVQRDLLGGEPALLQDLQERIALEGWGRLYLEQRQPAGYWGRGFYQPKWTSSHYTLLDLRNIGCPPANELARESVRQIFLHEKGRDGGLNPSRTIGQSDACINGMALNYGAWFGLEERLAESVVDFILAQVMPDGGFNCRLNRSGAVHSSMHTTISVLEGIEEYRRSGYQYRMPELLAAAASSRAFLLKHHLYKSDHTGEVIKPQFLRLTWPVRWHYDIQRALDYFRLADPRILADPRAGTAEALEVIRNTRRPDGTWPMQAAYPGAVHFVMEQAGRPSRWNTLRAMRVLAAADQTTDRTTGNVGPGNDGPG